MEQKLSQWSLRITAYADRLLEGLTQVDFSESLKEQQGTGSGNQGASVRFTVNDHHWKLKCLLLDRIRSSAFHSWF